MITKQCEICNSPFSVRKYREKTARFCSRSCRARWVSALPHSCGRGKPRPDLIGNKLRAGLRPANAFPAGHTPWTKGLKGIHLAPATEFKPGPRPDLRSIIGDISIRRTRDGHLRAFVKIADPNKWKLRAVKNWEGANGQVPRGRLIHHIDRDTLNDDIHNLACLTRAEHLAEHRSEFAIRSCRRRATVPKQPHKMSDQ